MAVKFRGICVFFLVSASAIATAEAHIGLVKDLSPGNGNSVRAVTCPYLADDEATFFSASDGIGGDELWRSDGTAAGTHALTNLHKKHGDSLWYRGAAKVGDRFIFCLEDNDNDVLISTDGTAAGTFTLMTLPLLSDWEFTTMNGVFYFFVADLFDQGNELKLYRTDGTVQGTCLVKALPWFPLETFNTLPRPVVYKGRVYFVYCALSQEFSLWCSDGTEAGTHMAVHLPPFSSYDRIVVNGGTMYIGYDLTVSDGTISGTLRVFDRDTWIRYWQTSPTLGAFAVTVEKDLSAAHLWHVTGHGRRIVYDISVNPRSALNLENMPFTYCPFPEIDGKAFFLLPTDRDSVELVVSDGTHAGTHAVYEFPVHDDFISSYEMAGTLFEEFVACGKHVYFVAPKGTDVALWRSDGTTDGTVPIFTSSTDRWFYIEETAPRSLTPVSDKLYFAAGRAEGFVTLEYPELYVVDGSSPATRVKDINPGPAGSFPGIYAAVHGELFFSANDGVHGQELWKTDGTEAGTVMVKDIRTSEDTEPSEITAFGDGVAFVTGSSHPFYKLCFSDGTESGTRMADSIGFWGIEGVAGGKLILTGNPGLYFSDGTLSGTVRYTSKFEGYNSKSVRDSLGNVWVASESAVIRTDGTVGGSARFSGIFGEIDYETLTAVGPCVYFVDVSSTGKKQLWRAQQNATVVKDLGYASLSDLVAFKGNLYFLSDSGNQTSLWKSDGTASGTVSLCGINVQETWRQPAFTAMDDHLLFSSKDEEHGVELWSSDGNSNGILADINPGPGSSSPINLFVFDHKLFFAADDGVHGVELWTTDGTTGGTYMVKDINPGAAGSAPCMFVNFNGVLCFAADNGTLGQELWTTDGTGAGTYILYDINPGINSSQYGVGAVSGSRYFFSANDGVHGYEIWAADEEVFFDADADGIPTSVEGTVEDMDQDGKPNHIDTDSDNDSLSDATEGMDDVDNDGQPNMADRDSDGDGMDDGVEVHCRRDPYDPHDTGSLPMPYAAVSLLLILVCAFAMFARRLN